MLTGQKMMPCVCHFPSGRGDRGAADVRQEGAGPIRGGQPETTEGREGGETRRAVDRQ